MGKKKKGGGGGGKKGGKGGGEGKGGDDKLKSCRQVKVKHILVDKYSQAQKIYGEITGTYGNKIPSSKFGDFAREHSTCPSKKRGGDLGWFGKGKMNKEFEKIAFGMQKGQLSNPFKTDNGYHIVLCEGRK